MLAAWLVRLDGCVGELKAPQRPLISLTGEPQPEDADLADLRIVLSQVLADVPQHIPHGRLSGVDAGLNVAQLFVGELSAADQLSRGPAPVLEVLIRVLPGVTAGWQADFLYVRWVGRLAG